jgi:hypothetical protein
VLICEINSLTDLLFLNKTSIYSCKEGFYGVRCQTVGSDLNNSSSQSTSGKSSVNGTITAIVVVLVIIVVIIAAATAAVPVMRKRGR